MIEDNIVGLPFATSNHDETPITYDELSTLKEGDIIWILDEENEDEDQMAAWIRGTFKEFDGHAIIYKNSAGEDVMRDAENDEERGKKDESSREQRRAI